MSAVRGANKLLAAKAAMNGKSHQLATKVKNKVVVYEEDDDADILEAEEEIEEAEDEVEEAAEEAEEAEEEAEVAVVKSAEANQVLADEIRQLVATLNRNMAKTHISGITTTPSDRSITRRMTFEFVGSLEDMQNAVARSKASPADCMALFGSRTRWGHDCSPAKDRKGDLRNVLIQFVNFVGYDNGFPCKVAFKFPEIHHARGNWRDARGDQFAGICFAKDKWHGKEIIMVESDYHKSEFFKKYPNYHLENMFEQGILHTKDQPEIHMVSVSHPVLEYLVADEEGVKFVQNVRPTVIGRDSYYEVPTPHFLRAIKLLESHGRAELPRYDMTKFEIQIVRPDGRLWIDTDEVADNMVSPELIAKQLKQLYRLTIFVEVCFAFM